MELTVLALISTWHSVGRAGYRSRTEHAGSDALQRTTVALLGTLTALVVVFGSIIWNQQREVGDRLRTLECIARVSATADLALMIPASQVDEQGRVDSARTLSSLLDDC
jgi:hypothetical protein